MQSYSLYELNEYIRRVIALNFPEPIWINCEIAQVKESRGNVYLDLVDQDENTGEIKAAVSANIWYKSYLFLKNKLGDLLPSLLAQGVHVKVKVTVEFHERYGLKLNIEDIDPSYTIGQLEMARQKIVQKLTEEGIIHMNKMRTFPTVIQRIAVISAENAAGYQDFVQQLTKNRYGYAFRLHLFKAALQGLNTEREVCAALDEIKSMAEQFDCIAIIRGGGSKLDLGGFDSYNIGSKIAQSPLPVITGIGHDVDQTIADIVANTPLKTPTAVAEHIINHNLDFERKLMEGLHWITQLAGRQIRHHDHDLKQFIQLLKVLPTEKIKYQRQSLDNILSQCRLSISFIIAAQKEKLNNFDRQIRQLHPDSILKRGFAMVRSDNHIIQNTLEAEKHQDFEIVFHDGNLKVTKKT